MTHELLHEHGPIRVRRCRHGVMAYLATDMYVGRSLDRYGEFSEAELDLLAGLVGPGDTVLDVGANVGVHTVLFARRVGSSGSVHAYEPQRVFFELLCTNLVLNGLVQARPYRAAVGEQAGAIHVPEPDLSGVENFSGLELGSWREGEEVPLVRVDDLRLERCALVKIDVEGMELKVLRGAAQTIADRRPVLYVENDRTERSAALIGWLLEAHYRLFWHLPPLYNPDNFAEHEENLFPGLVSANLLALPRGHDMTPASGLREVTSTHDHWRR